MTVVSPFSVERDVEVFWVHMSAPNGMSSVQTIVKAHPCAQLTGVICFAVLLCGPGTGAVGTS